MLALSIKLDQRCILKRWELQLDSSKPINSVFVTGTTGVLGGYLLKDLLNLTDAHFFCLVRAASVEQGFDRLLKSLRIYDDSPEIEKTLRLRVTPVVGDIEQPNFAIEPTLLQRILSEADAMIHAAANTNLMCRYSDVYRVNVVGTQNAIEFALQTKNKFLCYVSTFSIIGNAMFDSDVRFKETDFDFGQKYPPSMPYQRSKFEAEFMVREARERGLNWLVVRPGQIFGDSRTGRYPFTNDVDASSLFYDIFKTIIETGLAFQSRSQFDVTPVDYVSRGIIALALQKPQLFETYHLTNPDIKTYSQILRLIQNLGYYLNVVPIPTYKDMLKAGKLMYRGSVYRSATTRVFWKWLHYDNYDFTGGGITECGKTAALLAQKGVFCSPIDENLVRVYTSRYSQIPEFTESVSSVDMTNAL